MYPIQKKMVADNFNKETTFNEAVLKMQRIHAAQESINELRTNLLAWNMMYQKYNYEVVISNLISLCYEVMPLMKVKEQKEFLLIRGLVDDLLNNKPIHEQVNISDFGNSKPKEKINNDNWVLLRKTMFLFEDFARGQIETHGLSAPKKKDPSKAAMDF